MDYAVTGGTASDHYMVGLQLLLKGQTGVAVGHFRRALEVDPTMARAYRGLGLAHARDGKKALARAAFGRYLALNPEARDAAVIRRRIEMLR